MQKISLPIALQLALKQHTIDANIEDDDELKMIMHKLSALNEKIELLKLGALRKRNQG